jgi:hypothetical protein
MDQLAKILVLFGFVLIVIGGLVFLLGRLNLPLGRLPGDIRIDTGGATCFFPLATMIILSVILTLVINLIIRIFR